MSGHRESQPPPHLSSIRTLTEDIFDTVRAPMLVLAGDLRIVRASASFFRHFGVTAAETVGRRLPELGDGQWAVGDLPQRLEMILPGENPLQGHELELSFGRQQNCTLLLDARPIDGLQLILLTMEDITARKQALAELAASEERCRTLVEASSQAVWEMDATGMGVGASPSWRAYTGQTLEECRDHGWMNAVHPEDREYAERKWQEAVAAQHKVDLELRLRSKEGGWRWTHVCAAPVRDELGRIVKWAGMNLDISDRKRVEAALQDREQNYRTLTELSPEAIVVSAGGRLVFVNAAAARLFGAADATKILGRSPMEFVPDAYQDLVSKRLTQVVESGTPVPVLVYPWKRIDGSLVDVEVISGPITWEGIKAVQAVARDVTERRQSEEKIRRQSAVLQGINRIFREALICETEEDLRNVSLQVAEQLTGSQFGFIGEINGSGRLVDLAISNPGWTDCQMDRDEVHARLLCGMAIHGLYGRVVHDGRGFYTNEPTSHPDSIGLPAGHPPLDSFLGVPLIRDGQTIGVVAVGNRAGGYGEAEMEDLETLAGTIVQALMRKKAETALIESKERFRQLADSMPQLVWSADSAGKVDYYNERYREFNGLTQLPDGSWEWAPVIHPDDREQALLAWQDAIRAGTPLQMELRIQRADGTFGWFLSRTRPIRDAEGRIVRWYGTATDIDELKQAELALGNAKREAETANRAKSEFLANMSHEIRTPMTIFLMAIERLSQIDPDPEHQQLLEMADRSAARLRALIEDILDFSKIEARQVSLEEEPFDLQAWVRDAVELFTLPAQEKDLTLELSIAPGTPQLILGDSNKLKQVLINLLSNAIKFTTAGEIRVSVQPRGAFLQFDVADTGIGIAEEKQHLLFQSFSQLETSLHRRQGGTGLGLAISRGLVELMGGWIRLQSREGEGSTFTFCIPLKSIQEPIDRPPGEKPATVPDRAGVHILLADDEPMIREIIAMTLIRRGWHTETVETGRGAVDKWAKGDFQIVLMDLQMPGLDGLEATRRIRQLEKERGKHTCIIGLTAHARSEVRELCRQAGMDQVLIKPIQSNDLFALIESCLLKRVPPAETD